MFTALQLALATTSRYAGVNILSAAAFGMLLWRPSYLFHVGFQLSFLSVAAILPWGIPLYRRLRTPWRAANAAVGMLVVGAVASTATAPLVSYCFGQIPLVGLAVNPPVILLTYGVVGVSLLWLAIPWPPFRSSSVRCSKGCCGCKTGWSPKRPPCPVPRSTTG